MRFDNCYMIIVIVAKDGVKKQIHYIKYKINYLYIYMSKK